MPAYAIHAWAETTHTKEAQHQPVFGLKDVIEKARVLASEHYQDPRGKMPQWLLDITYDQLRDIRLIPYKAYWRKEKMSQKLP